MWIKTHRYLVCVKDHFAVTLLGIKYCRINKNWENRLYVHIFTLFSLELFDMRIEKAAVFFDKVFNLMFLLCFSVIRWNFGIFSVLYNGAVYLLVEWT